MVCDTRLVLGLRRVRLIRDVMARVGPEVLGVQTVRRVSWPLIRGVGSLGSPAGPGVVSSGAPYRVGGVGSAQTVRQITGQWSGVLGVCGSPTDPGVEAHRE